MEILKNIFELIQQIEGFLQISKTGHFEHFIVGSLIGGLISYLYFEKTNHRLKSMVFGISLGFFIGLLKEFIDPIIGGDKNKLDLIYTFLGSMTGALLFLLNSLVRKKLI